MQKLFFISVLSLILMSCGDNKTPTQENSTQAETAQEEAQAAPAISLTKNNYDLSFDSEKIHHFEENQLDIACNDSSFVCQVELAVKCTINNKMDICKKDNLPNFIFIDEEFANRPTKIVFKVTDIKQVSPNTISVYTNSQCNGTWYGLCQGKVIYVLNKDNNGWNVADIYALGI